MYLHLAVISILGGAVLWSIRLVHGREVQASDNLLLLAATIVGWVLVLLGLFFACTVPVALAALVIFAMVVARYRQSERRTLLWMLAAAADRKIPLVEAVRCFSAGRKDEVGRRARRLANLLDQGQTLPQALRGSRHSLQRDAQLFVNLGASSRDLGAHLRAALDINPTLQMARDAWYGMAMYLVVFINLAVACSLFILLKTLPTWSVIVGDFDMEMAWSMKLLVQAAAWDHWLVGLSIALLILANTTLLWMVLHYLGVPLPEFPWRIPGYGDDHTTSRLLRGLAMSIESGYALPQAVDALAEQDPSRRLRHQLRRVSARLQAGIEWCEAMVRSGLIRANEATLLRASSRAEHLPWTMRHVAEMRERRFNYRTAARLRILGPLLIILSALPVGMLAFAVFDSLARLIQELSL
jgi:type II secretory pathway component PulF